MPAFCLRLSLLAATVLGIHGCMSSPTDQLAAVNASPAKKLTSQTASLQANTAANVADQSAIANQAAADVALLNSTSNPVGDVPPAAVNADKPVTDANILVGRKSINAAQNSIFANPDTSSVPVRQADQQQVAVNDIENGAQPDQTMNAARSSIYSGAVENQPRETSSLPLPDADNVAAVQDLALAGMAIPDELNTTPVTPTEADPGLANAAAQFEQQTAIASLDPAAQHQNVSVAAVEQQPKQVKKKHTLADFFRGDFADEEEEGLDNSRFAQHKQRTINTSQIPNMQTAALGDNQLPGVNTNAMFATEQHFSDDEMSEGGDQPGLMQLASLSGMTRVAPNGLWTQTDKVEVRCLRPQLVSLLKSVEDHYKRPVIVTSGFRDVGHNRRVGGVRHSLHTLCAAADIQVQGVSKWALADYLRSVPGRGGVGTYCHTDSVHVDIGEERDWNWRCRRKKHRRS